MEVEAGRVEARHDDVGVLVTHGGDVAAPVGEGRVGADEPAGRARGDIPEKEHPRLSILLDADSIQVSAYPSGQGVQLAANDWAKLGTALKDFQLPDETPRVEIAALSTNAHPISYQSLVLAMDTAMKAGYPDVGVTDPSSLAR